jgi:hypothetical protein
VAEGHLVGVKEDLHANETRTEIQVAPRHRTLGVRRSPPPDPDPGPAIFRLDFPCKGSVVVEQRAFGLCLGPARPDRLTGEASGGGSAAALAVRDA